MARAICPAIIAALAVLICANVVSCQVADLVNTFDVNWNEYLAKSKSVRSSEFSPPATSQSKFSWVATSFDSCVGCGSRSFKQLKHDCIHKLPIQLTAGTFTKSLMGVFRVPEDQCPELKALQPVSKNGCGPPCSNLRLLRGERTGCRCDHIKKLAYDVPRLICQDNKNLTVSLALCKFFYEKNTVQYQAELCDYALICKSAMTWLGGNWTKCSDNNPTYQKRDVVCVAQSAVPPQIYYVMHESMCPASLKPSKLQFCARWVIERTFRRCNCGTRRAFRGVLCMRESPKAYGRGSKLRVDEAECSWHPKPESERACDREQLRRDCNIVTP